MVNGGTCLVLMRAELRCGRNGAIDGCYGGMKRKALVTTRFAMLERTQRCVQQMV